MSCCEPGCCRTDRQLCGLPHREPCFLNKILKIDRETDPEHSPSSGKPPHAFVWDGSRELLGPCPKPGLGFAVVPGFVPWQLVAEESLNISMNKNKI